MSQPRQETMFGNAFDRETQRNATWLELLPTLTRNDLERLIARRPRLWGRFASYLTSGHKFLGEL